MVQHSGRGGMYTYTDALCRGLCGIGVEVTVVTSSAWPDGGKPYKVERLFKELAAKQNEFSRLHWAADRMSRSMINILRRNKFALDGNFDAVHIQGAGLPLLDQFFLKTLVKKLPVILTVHDCVSHYERFVSRDSFMRRNLLIPDRLIVHYENGKRQLEELWKIASDKIDVIPHGIIPVDNQPQLADARNKLGLPLDKKILLFFGSIRPNKGLDVLLKSLQDVVRQNSDVLLVIAGAMPRGMSFQPYSDIIKELNLSENVKTFIKFIPDEDIDYFLGACDIVVLPYVQFEAQSGVLLRAFTHKKPVVVSDIGAMGEIVRSEKVGIAVPPGSEESLTYAINNILKNPRDYESHYTAELEMKYGWEHISKLTLQCCEKAIAQKKK
ncbi:MAG: glycosyltransferase [Sedimentisphaerales bacterium]|nr:glycosyltransferase [Sedimentisphaerales bacterium]